MQVKSLFSNGFSFGLFIHRRINSDVVGRFTIQRLRSAEGVGNERRDGAEDKGWEIQHGGGENFGVISGGESGSKRGNNRTDLEVIEQISTLVQLERGVLAFGDGFNRRDMGFGCGYLLRGFGRSGQHLNYFFERGGIGLDESGRVRVCRFGSVRDSGRWRRRRWWLKPIGGGGGGGGLLMKPWRDFHGWVSRRAQER